MLCSLRVMVMLFNSDELTFQILNVDQFSHVAGFFCVEARPFAALSYRLSGSATFEINGSSFKSYPGNILYLPDGVDYSAEYTDGESIVVHLLGCNYRQVEYYVLHNPRYLERLFIEMLEDWRATHRINRVKAAVYTLLQELEDDQVKNYGAALSTCLSYLQEHFRDPMLKVSDLCRIGGISESVLYRKFQMYFAVSPKQYILRMRLNYAMQLLARGDESVRNISNLSGFKDEKYFSRIIKERFGEPPSFFLGLGSRT